MIIAIAIVGIMLLHQSYSVAATKKYKTVTAYYCDPGEGTCISHKGNGDIWVSIPGILRVVTIRVPATIEEVPEAPAGYDEVNTFFLFSDPNDLNVGIGLIDGILHYSSDNPEFYYYELEQQSVITDFNQWKQLAE